MTLAPITAIAGLSCGAPPTPVARSLAAFVAPMCIAGRVGAV